MAAPWMAMCLQVLMLASYGPVQIPNLPEGISVKFNMLNITVVNGAALLNVGTAKRWLMFCYCGFSLQIHVSYHLICYIIL